MNAHHVSALGIDERQWKDLFSRLALPLPTMKSLPSTMISAATQGLTLLHFSPQRRHFLRDTLGGCSGSEIKSGSGGAG